MAEQRTETWDIWYPKAGAAGIPFARGRIGQPIAEGTDLEATGDTPGTCGTRMECNRLPCDLCDDEG